MKKVLLFIAITLPLLFTSCSSEKIENNPLLGTWEKMTDGDYEEIRFYHDLTVVRSVVDKDSKAITETRGDYVLKEDAIIVLKWTSERKKKDETDNETSVPFIRDKVFGHHAELRLGFGLMYKGRRGSEPSNAKRGRE